MVVIRRTSSMLLTIMVVGCIYCLVVQPNKAEAAGALDPFIQGFSDAQARQDDLAFKQQLLREIEAQRIAEEKQLAWEHDMAVKAQQLREIEAQRVAAEKQLALEHDMAVKAQQLREVEAQRAAAEKQHAWENALENLAALRESANAAAFSGYFGNNPGETSENKAVTNLIEGIIGLPQGIGIRSQEVTRRRAR